MTAPASPIEALAETLPSNICIIEHTYELPHGTMRLVNLDSESDAVYYANGKQAYLFRSKIIKASYLFIPIK